MSLEIGDSFSEHAADLHERRWNNIPDDHAPTHYSWPLQPAGRSETCQAVSRSRRGRRDTMHGMPHNIAATPCGDRI